jgi:hypothetical protein
LFFKDEDHDMLLPIMTLTTHAAIGAAIGTLVGNPLLGFTLGLASHFLVDMIPHGDNELSDRFHVHKKKKAPVAYVTVDYTLSFILTMMLVALRPDGISNLGFTAAVVGSVLPDLMVGAADLFKKNPLLRAYRKFHFFFHDFFSRKHGDIKLRYSLLAQAVVVAVLINFVIR